MSSATDIDFEGIWTDEFLAEVDKRKEKSDIDPTQWRAGGRASKAWPNKEDSAWWLTNGPAMLEKWHCWWLAAQEEGFTVWRTATGVPAIELAVNAVIGGVMLRGYIDAILQDPDGALVLVDWKTSAMEPVAPMQLGVYRVAVQKTLGVDIDLGVYYMAKKGELGHVYDLTVYDEATVGPWLQKAKRMEQQQLFIPKPSSLCSACGVRDYCKIMTTKPELAETIPQF